MTRVELPFFDFLLERFAAGDTEMQTAFGRHVHWGYWPDPSSADGSTADFAEAAERMSRRMYDAAAVRDGSRVLDVGCGFGGTLASMNDRFDRLHLVGANVDLRQLARARTVVVPRPGNVVDLVQCDGCALPFAAGAFDAIMAVESIFHYRSRADFFGEVRRLLRPGGRLVVSDFVPPPSYRALVRLGYRLVRPIVSSGYAEVDNGCTVDDYRALGAEHGLELKSQDDVTDNTLPTYPVLRRVVQDGSSWSVRAVTATSEWVSGAGVVRYTILAFEAV